MAAIMRVEDDDADAALIADALSELPNEFNLSRWHSGDVARRYPNVVGAVRKGHTNDERRCLPSVVSRLARGMCSPVQGLR